MVQHYGNLPFLSLPTTRPAQVPDSRSGLLQNANYKSVASEYDDQVVLSHS